LANARGKSIDNTHLSIDQALDRGFVHQDYIAHCLRWSFVVRKLSEGQKYKTARVLDVGCGVDIPLAKLLYSSKMSPAQYVALDYNSPDKLKVAPFHTGKFPIRAFGGVDFASDDVQVQSKIDCATDPAMTLDRWYTVLGSSRIELPNVVTCFEVLEHVEPEHAVRMLRKIRYLLAASGKDARAYVSTPCWDPHVGAAGNHVNEMRREALGSAIENLGLVIEENYGTFASQKDYRDHMFAEYPEMKQVWERLKGYYSSSYIATIFAPLYPDRARNNFWVLRVPRDGEVVERTFPSLADVKTPWTSSDHWRGLETSLEPSAIPEVA
jgi:hypothetical protein